MRLASGSSRARVHGEENKSMTRAEILTHIREVKAKAAERKAKRFEKRQALWPGKAPAASKDARGCTRNENLGPSARNRVVGKIGVFPGHSKKHKKSEWKFWRDKCDVLFSLYIRLRDKKNHGVCRICFKRPIECCYHLIPRSRLVTRFDPNNAVGACHGCNFGEQKHRLVYRDKHIKIFGKDFYEALEDKARPLVKFSAHDLQAMATEIKEMTRLLSR